MIFFNAYKCIQAGGITVFCHKTAIEQSFCCHSEPLHYIGLIRNVRAMKKIKSFSRFEVMFLTLIVDLFVIHLSITSSVDIIYSPRNC